MDGPRKPEWKTRVFRGGFADRQFDIEFWQEQGDEAIFRAAWEMVLIAERNSQEAVRAERERAAKWCPAGVKIFLPCPVVTAK